MEFINGCGRRCSLQASSVMSHLRRSYTRRNGWAWCCNWRQYTGQRSRISFYATIRSCALRLTTGLVPSHKSRGLGGGLGGGITASSIQAGKGQLLTRFHLNVYAHGNLCKEDVLKFTNMIKSTLKLRPSPSTQWPIMPSLVLPPGSR